MIHAFIAINTHAYRPRLSERRSLNLISSLLLCLAKDNLSHLHHSELNINLFIVVSISIHNYYLTYSHIKLDLWWAW